MKIIKKFWYIFLLAIILVIVMFIYFLGKENTDVNEQINKNNENKQLLTYAEDYFNNYVNVLGINEYNVTIKMLKDAVNLELASYDMTELEKCEDDSYATIFIKTGETTLDKIDSYFKCTD